MKLTHELLEINAVAMVECIVPPEHSKDSGSKAAYKMGHAHGQKKSKMVDAGKVFGVNAGAYKAGHAAGSTPVNEDKGDLDDYVSDKPASKSKTKEGWFVVDKRTKLDIHAGPFSDRQEARDEADDYDGAVVQYGHALPNGDFEKLAAPVDEAHGIYEPITDAEVSSDNGSLERRGGKLQKNKNGTMRVVTDGDKTLKQSGRKVKESQDEDEEGDEEQDQNTFYVAFYESDEKHAWIGKVSKEGGGKWHESSYKGTADDRWGQHYMSYLSPEDIMGWIKKDYGRHIEIEGPFFDAEEAKEYVTQNWGKTIKEDSQDKQKIPRKGTQAYANYIQRKKQQSDPENIKRIEKIGNQDHMIGTAKVIHKEEAYTNYADWKQAVILSHPAQAKSIKFRGKMEGEKTTVSAIIPGEDKVFGIWDDAITSGTVLSEVQAKKYEKGKSDLDAAFNYLNTLIKGGAEYPDAEHKAATKFSVSAKQLRKAYDEQK